MLRIVAAGNSVWASCICDTKVIHFIELASLAAHNFLPWRPALLCGRLFCRLFQALPVWVFAVLCRLIVCLYKYAVKTYEY